MVHAVRISLFGYKATNKGLQNNEKEHSRQYETIDGE